MQGDFRMKQSRGAEQDSATFSKVMSESVFLLRSLTEQWWFMIWNNVISSCDRGSWYERNPLSSLSDNIWWYCQE